MANCDCDIDFSKFPRAINFMCPHGVSHRNPNIGCLPGEHFWIKIRAMGDGPSFGVKVKCVECGEQRELWEE